MGTRNDIKRCNALRDRLLLRNFRCDFASIVRCSHPGCELLRCSGAILYRLPYSFVHFMAPTNVHHDVLAADKRVANVDDCAEPTWRGVRVLSLWVTSLHSNFVLSCAADFLCC